MVDKFCAFFNASFSCSFTARNPLIYVLRGYNSIIIDTIYLSI